VVRDGRAINALDDEGAAEKQCRRWGLMLFGKVGYLA
tara:strand:+ start:612 stop:722 length:111 start_codon:yes stop_codon:yes gene_type:complete